MVPPALARISGVMLKNVKPKSSMMLVRSPHSDDMPLIESAVLRSPSKWRCPNQNPLRPRAVICKGPQTFTSTEPKHNPPTYPQALIKNLLWWHFAVPCSHVDPVWGVGNDGINTFTLHPLHCPEAITEDESGRRRERSFLGRTETIHGVTPLPPSCYLAAN